MRKYVLLVWAMGWLLTACAAGKPSLETYKMVQAKLTAYRDSVALVYPAQSPEKKARSIQDARAKITLALDKFMFPAWYGTPWDFNGVSQTPGEGMIACGYFITTLLRDAGFQLERARLAQQASLFIIRSLCPKTERYDWAYLSAKQVAEKVKTLPKGLYIVGLDIHTGFILHTAEGVFFVHSSYMKPAEVLRENAADSKVLGASNRHVLGRVDNDWLIDKWLRKQKIETVTG